MSATHALLFDKARCFSQSERALYENFIIRSNDELLLEPLRVKTLARLRDKASMAARAKLWKKIPLQLKQIDSLRLIN